MPRWRLRCFLWDGAGCQFPRAWDDRPHSAPKSRVGKRLAHRNWRAWACRACARHRGLVHERWLSGWLSLLRVMHAGACMTIPRPLVAGSVIAKSVLARSSGAPAALSLSTPRTDCRRLSEQRNLVTRDGPPDAHFRRMSGVMQEESGPRTHIARTNVVQDADFLRACWPL